MRLRVARKMSYSWRCKPLRRELAYNIKTRRYMRGMRAKYHELWANWCHFAERRPGGRSWPWKHKETSVPI